MTLAHLDFGEKGRPLIILHGLFGSGRNWSSIARKLAHSYRVYALDLPDHGRSPWTDGRLTYPAMAEAVRRWMDAHGIASAHVLGHSMGGKTAMQMALNHAERVDALIVADIAPVQYRGREHLSFIRAMQAVDLVGCERRAEVEQALVGKIEPEAIRKFLMQNLVNREDGSGLRWQINLDVLGDSMDDLMDFPLEPEMEPYGGPTLFLAGGASDYVQDAHEPVIGRLFLDHAIHRIEGTGHWLHAEQPALFTEHVLDFLARAA